MFRTLAVTSALASLALAASSQAQQITKPLSAIGSSSLVGKVACRGVSAVPMTADEEQSLPLQVVSELSCGEPVAILSDSQGYTLNIRTAEGKTGYVARLYVVDIVRTAALAPKSVEAGASVRNGVARWQAGATGSDEFDSNGAHIESLTVNGVTVQVSLQDTGWKFRATVAVANQSAQHVFVNPARFTLQEAAPGYKSLPYQDPVALAKAMNHQILWTSATAGSAQGVSVEPASYRTESPNYVASQQTNEEIARRNQSLLNSVEQINTLALHSVSVQANDKAAGTVWFERDPKCERVVMRVPVEGTIFEFPLSFNHEK